MPGVNREHYRGDYQRRARLVRTLAASNPATTCWRCGRTLDQHPPHHNGQRPTWTAGHLVDGNPDSALAPEASTCNLSDGATLGNRRRQGLNTTRSW